MKSTGQAEPDSFVKKILGEIEKEADDSLKIEKLSELAFYFFDVAGDKQLADSLGQEAVELAQASYRPRLMLLAYNRYIECNDQGLFYQKAIHYAEEAVKTSKLVNDSKLNWRSYANLSKVYISGYRYDKALVSSYQALALADAMEDMSLKVQSYLLIGESLEGNNQKIESFRNYLNATSLAEKMEFGELKMKCYSQLAGFYNMNKVFDKAILYKLRQVEIILHTQPVDSAALMWAQYDLQAININSNNNSLNSGNVRDVLNYAIRNNLSRLKSYMIALYRSHLIESEQIGRLHNFYQHEYPSEFQQLALQNPALYYRLNAYFNEEASRPDAALYCFIQAEKIMRTDANKILSSNFYQRFGQFLQRQGKNKEAISKYLRALELASEASYLEYMVSASKNLQSLYASLGDFQQAYKYSKMNRILADSVNLLTKNDQLLLMEIDHETRQRELAAEQEEAKTHRSHNIQYTAISIITITMFIILMMLGSLKVPSWIIKMLGFFSFILFFEFIIMIADHKIYAATANEPWKILLLKIGLIAFLLPFHHWIEKRVIHFLINHNLILIPRFSMKSFLRKRLGKSTELASTEDQPPI